LILGRKAACDVNSSRTQKKHISGRNVL